MAEKLTRSTKILIGVIGTIVIVGAALAFWFPSWLEDSRKEAYEIGYYERSLEASEEAWDDTRIELVRTALYISTCDERVQNSCDLLKDSRDLYAGRVQPPERLDEGDISDYQRASKAANNRVSSTAAWIDENDYYIEQIRENSIDEDLDSLIAVTLSEARSAQSSLSIAEQELVKNPDNKEIQEAKADLEAVYREIEMRADLPTGWGSDDVEDLLEELRDARGALDEETLIP